MTQTNWSSSISIPKFEPKTIPDFDPVFGSLDSITFTLTGQVQGNAGFESRDNTPATVTLDMSALIRLQRPDASDLWFSVPTASVTESVAAFDDVIDFAGYSGRTYTGLAQSTTSSVTTLLPSDLSLFIGSGNIILPVTAKGF
ncbi:choice-of-anchor E domain-containing protein [Planctomycetota bacterium]